MASLRVFPASAKGSGRAQRPVLRATRQIVWFYDHRDVPKGLAALPEDDLPRLQASLPRGAELVNWRRDKTGQGVGAAMLRFRSEASFEEFQREHRTLELEFRTEMWIREFDPRKWFIGARRSMGPATLTSAARRETASPCATALGVAASG